MLLEYFEAANEDSQNRLYANSWTCIALTRLLPPLARQYILRIVCVDDPVPSVTLRSWALDSAAKEHEAAVQILVRLRLLQPRVSNAGTEFFVMHQVFQKSARYLLAQRDVTPFPVKKDKEKHVLSASALRQQAMQRWDAVLGHLVEEGSEGDESICQLLLRAKLLQSERGQQRYSITREGFQFLLRDVQTQVWTLLLDLIRNRSIDTAVQNDDLNCAMQLSFCQHGQGYAVEALSESQKFFVKELDRLGLVYMRSTASKRFYPTHLLLGLGSDRPMQLVDDASVVKDFHVIVEANFRIYAYTDSPLHERAISYFARINCRLPNLVAASLTRASVRNALIKGITAQQIIDFLEMHAHPECPLPIIPAAIAHQIRLWEKERSRLNAKPSVMYSNFANNQVFLQVAAFAQTQGCCLYRSDATMTLIIAKEKEPVVRDYVKQLRESLGA